MPHYLLTNKVYAKLSNNEHNWPGRMQAIKDLLNDILKAIEEKNEPKFIELYDSLKPELKKYAIISGNTQFIHQLSLLSLLHHKGLKTSLEHVFKTHYPSASLNDRPAKRKTVMNLTKYLENLWPRISDKNTASEGQELLKYFLTEHPLSKELITPCYEFLVMSSINSYCWESVEYLLSPTFKPQMQKMTSLMYGFLLQLAVNEKMELAYMMAENLTPSNRLDMMEECEKTKNRTKDMNPADTRNSNYYKAAQSLFNMFTSGLEKKKLLSHISEIEPAPANSTAAPFKV